MRKIGSKALLSGVVMALGMVALSHEANAGMVYASSETIAKETLSSSGSSVTLPFVSISSAANASGSIVIALQNATFSAGSYTFSSSAAGVSCTASNVPSNASSITFIAASSGGNCDIFNTATTANSFTAGLYTLGSTNPSGSLAVTLNGNAPVTITYNSTVSNDPSSSATLANILQQFSMSTSATSYTINPYSLSVFNVGSTTTTSATNSIVVSNSAYNNGWYKSVSSTQTVTGGTSYPELQFLFTGIPSSVNNVSFSDLGGINGGGDTGVVLQQNNSASVLVTLATTGKGVLSNPSDTYSFVFMNSGDISTGNINVTAYSVSGAGNIKQSITYLSNTPFLSFIPGGIPIYLPNVQSGSTFGGWVKITGPSPMSVASVSVLNTGVSCSVSSSSETNGNATTVYINLSQLQSACSGSNLDWAVGLPVEILVSGSNLSFSNVAAYAYQNYNGFFKRIPALIGGPSEAGN